MSPHPQHHAAWPQAVPHHQPHVMHQAPLPAPEVPAKPRSIETLTVPVLLVGSFAVFLVGATYLATTEFTDLKHSVEKLTLKIDGITEKITGRIDRIEADNSANLTRKDHELWCASAERANRNIGWACLEHPGQAPRPPTVPTVQGWQVKTSAPR